MKSAPWSLRFIVRLSHSLPAPCLSAHSLSPPYRREPAG